MILLILLHVVVFCHIYYFHLTRKLFQKSWAAQLLLLLLTRTVISNSIRYHFFLSEKKSQVSPIFTELYTTKPINHPLLSMFLAWSRHAALPLYIPKPSIRITRKKRTLELLLLMHFMRCMTHTTHTLFHTFLVIIIVVPISKQKIKM